MINEEKNKRISLFWQQKDALQQVEQAKQRAKDQKEARIQEAIKNGAKVQYIQTTFTPEERETLISINPITGIAEIDTSVPKMMTLCIKRGWNIKSVTYNHLGYIQAMTFTGSAKKISIGTNTGTENVEVDEIDVFDDEEDENCASEES